MLSKISRREFLSQKMRFTYPEQEIVVHELFCNRRHARPGSKARTHTHLHPGIRLLTMSTSPPRLPSSEYSSSSRRPLIRPPRPWSSVRSGTCTSEARWTPGPFPQVC